MSLSGLVLRPLLLLALQALLPLARLPLDSQPSHRHRHISRPRWRFSTFLARYFVNSNNEKLYFPAGTVNTKMLLEGWGPCGIPLAQADDTFWQATSKEVSASDLTSFLCFTFLQLDLSCSGSYFVSRQNRGKGNFTEKEVKELVAFLEQCLLPNK